MENIYDTIIVGSGPSGMSAAIYSTRGGYKTLVIERMGPGGQIMLTDIIDNYPGFPDGISGFELQDKMYKQALRFGMEMTSDAVKSITKDNDTFHIITDSGKTYRSLTVIIATGAKHKLLGAPGESLFSSKGVSYCGTCDGPFYRGKDVVVVGGGDTALTEALFIAKFAKSVTIVHRKERFRAVNALIEQLKKLQYISYRMDSVVEEIKGDKMVEEVVIKNIKTGKSEILKTDGVFIFVGIEPNTPFLDKSLLDNAGYVITNHKMETSIKGLFASGDVRSGTFRQVVCAASDGAVASHYAGEYVDELKGKSYK